MSQPQSAEPSPRAGKGTTDAAPQDSTEKKGGRGEGQNSQSASDPIAMLSADHRNVEKLFADFEKAKAPQQKSQLAKQVCLELVVHTLLEEEVFYPACLGHMEKRLLDEAQVEHDGAKALIIEIQDGSPGDDPYFDAKVKVLSENIKHHVREEEKPGDGILAKAREAGIATPELAARLATRKQELMEEGQADALDPPATRSFRVRTNTGRGTTAKENQMARGSSSTMERDDRGRFVGDNEDERDNRRSRSRYDEDDRRYSQSRYDDDRMSGGRSPYRDDDEDDRRYGRSRDEEERFTGGRPRSRYDDDDRERGRGHGGWFGDSGGHSRASREGWRESSHEGSGWYGDPEGHSRASREGWDERGRGGPSRSRYEGDDGDRRYGRGRDDEGRFTSGRSRSRYEEDDDRNRGRGHGGWYGDPEGHSEAARSRRR